MPVERCGASPVALPAGGLDLGVSRIVVTATRDGHQFEPPRTLAFPPEGALTGELDPRALARDPASGELLLLFSTSDFDPFDPHLATVVTWLAHLR
jgi:hypothetical protein